ncbi:hypothetical protein VPH35_066068 [Triticum aestivum]
MQPMMSACGEKRAQVKGRPSYKNSVRGIFVLTAHTMAFVASVLTLLFCFSLCRFFTSPDKNKNCKEEVKRKHRTKDERRRALLYNFPPKYDGQWCACLH